MKKIAKVLTTVAAVCLLGGCAKNTGPSTPLVTFIQVTTLPTKTTYYVDEEFDPTGMVVTAKYDDNTTAAVTDYTIADVDTSSVGEKEVVITYQRKMASFTIDVIEQSAEVHVESVTLNPKTLSLTVGGSSQTLTATVLPSDATNRSITWTSSDTSIATVTNGVVSPVSAGTAVIIVTTVDGGKTDTCTVTVSESGTVVPVSSVTLSPTSLSLSVGGNSATLAATVLPENATNRAVNWSIENANPSGCIAVNNGVVTPVSAGTATVKVTTVDGNKTATCSVTVTQSGTTVPVTGVSLSPTALNLTVGGSSSTLTATVAPSDATNRAVNWSVVNANPSGCVTVNNGVVAPVAAGTASVKVTTVDGGFTATCNVTVTSGSPTIDSTFTIAVDDVVEEYADTSFTSNGYTFGCENIGNSYTSGAIQWKKSGNGVMYNITPIDGLKSIKLASYSNKSFAGTITSGTSAQPTTNSASISNGTEYTFPNGVSYFKIVTTGSNASYCGDITIKSSVTPVNPTGISIPSSIDISAGKSKTLNVTYAPEDANTNLGVTWDSSNTSVATVDANGRVTVNSGANVGDSAVITATSTFDSSFTSECTVHVVELQKAAWTIMLYVCGADLESDSSGRYATQDIQELLAVRNQQPDNVKIIVETGGANSWGMSNVSKNELGRFEINSGSECTSSLMQKVGSTTLASMGDENTLKEFLEWGFDEYPADRYGVFMWNHGGAMDGCCFDELNDDDSLSSDEVYRAVKNARENSGITDKLDFIAYDACLMAVQDVAEMNSHNFDYMLCSQESEYAGGYDYDASFPTLYANPTTVSTETFLTKIANDFMNEQEADYHNDQTQSVLNLSYMATYLTKWNAMTTQIASVVTSSSAWTTFANAVNVAEKYGQYTDPEASGYNDGYLYDIFDVHGALTQLKTTYSSNTALVNAIQDVLDVLDDVVAYNRVGSQMKGKGLCFFCPISGYNLYEDYGNYAANYPAEATNFTSWRNFCVQYGNWYS